MPKVSKQIINFNIFQLCKSSTSIRKLCGEYFSFWINLARILCSKIVQVKGVIKKINRKKNKLNFFKKFQNFIWIFSQIFSYNT